MGRAAVTLPGAPSRRRRILLAAGALGVATTGARTTRAHDPNVDLETAVYAGTSIGGWTCGPTGTARYGGVGVNATISEHGRMHPDGPGMLAIAGVAVEREAAQVETCCVARTAAMAGMHARLGAGGRWFGFEAGALAFQGWPSSDLLEPRWVVLPDLKIRIGPPAVLYGVLGFGSDLPTVLRRPAILYTGLGGNYEWGGFDVRAGWSRAGPALVDDFSARLDATTRVRLVEETFLAPGLTVQIPDQGSMLGWEGSLTFLLGL